MSKNMFYTWQSGVLLTDKVILSVFNMICEYIVDFQVQTTWQ
jgi:hypothetical protein